MGPFPSNHASTLQNFLGRLWEWSVSEVEKENMTLIVKKYNWYYKSFDIISVGSIFILFIGNSVCAAAFAYVCHLNNPFINLLLLFLPQAMQPGILLFLWKAPRGWAIPRVPVTIEYSSQYSWIPFPFSRKLLLLCYFFQHLHKTVLAHFTYKNSFRMVRKSLTTPYDQTSQLSETGWLWMTSGAIHGNVPAKDIFVVLPINFEAPKSHICK